MRCERRDNPCYLYYQGNQVSRSNIAFFEIVFRLLAIEVVMRDLSNIANFLAFAFGFALDTYIRLVIEEKLIIGMVILRIVTIEDSPDEIVSFYAVRKLWNWHR